MSGGEPNIGLESVVTGSTGDVALPHPLASGASGGHTLATNMLNMQQRIVWPSPQSGHGDVPVTKGETKPIRPAVSMKALRRRGRTIKLIGPELEGLSDAIFAWADRLKKNIRVVNTQGIAPSDFYGMPLLSQMIDDDWICLFLSGGGSSGDDQGKWVFGFDEIEARVAPSWLSSPDFPAYANIVDSNGLFVGRVEGQFIYTVLYIPRKTLATTPETGGKGDGPDFAVATIAIDYVMERYAEIRRKHGREILGEVTDLSFREFCGDSLRRRQKTLRDIVEASTQSLKNLEEQIVREARSLREAEKEIELLDSGVIDRELHEQKERLLDLEKSGLYEGFKIRGGSLVGLTAPIVIRHEGKKYNLGQFIVSVDRSGKLEVDHLTKDHPFHPHISNGSTMPCFGTISTDIPRLIGMERYAMLFQIVHSFLSSYNPGNKYNTIEVCAGLAALPKMPEAREGGPQLVVPSPPDSDWADGQSQTPRVDAGR